MCCLPTMILCCILDIIWRENIVFAITNCHIYVPYGLDCAHHLLGSKFVPLDTKGRNIHLVVKDEKQHKRNY